MKLFSKKKMFAFVMACIMLITAVPATAFAQEQKADVTSGTEIETEVMSAEVTDLEETSEEETLAKSMSVEEKNGEYTYESNLPVVYINTENGVKITSKEDYVNATMKIQGNDTYSDSAILYDGEIEIRGRGNSTWSMPKKPYKIKLDKKSNLFDMGKNKHWVLLANYSDETLMRNTLAYNLSGAMGMPQMETVWVDVVLNGEYVGNYQFCEQIKIDKNNRVSIFDWESLAEDAAEVIATAENFSDDDAGDLEDYMKEENMSWITEGVVSFNGGTYQIADYPDIEVPDITGGYLMELDEYYDEVSKFRTNSNQPIMFKNPEFVGTNQDMMDYIQNYIQSFENAVQSFDYTAEYEGNTNHYSQLFDFDALVDYWLISEIFFNEELNKKSTYMYKDIDGLVYMGPIWDMDYSSGGEGQTWRTDQWATVFYNTNAQANMWYKDLIEDPYFVLRAQERYWEIRDTYVQNMVNSIDTSYALLKDSADANAAVWYNGNHDFTSEVNNLRSWFNTHLSWLDAQMASEDSLLNSLGYDAKALTFSMTDSAGEILRRDTVSEKNAADKLINIGESVILTVSSDTYNGQNAQVFVNGKKIGSVQVGSNIVITNEQLSADSGEKNIIEVKLESYSGVAKNCITVLETDTSVLPPQEPDQPEIEEPDKPEIVDPEYDGRDYPTTSMTAFADSQYSGPENNEGPVAYVLDGSEKTHWHTNWRTQEGKDINMRWIGVELAQSTMVDGIRCLPRQDGENGTVTSYEVQYRLTANEDWKTVATGDWDLYDKNWKLVSFDAVEAKYVRIVGVHTYASDGMDNHMSMAEFRVLQAGKTDGDVDNGGNEDSSVRESKLPVVYINTENSVSISSKEKYVNATMKIQGNDTYSDSSILYDGEIEIRGRGNSTWSMPKKPYKIKLDKKSNLFDMGKNKHWVLLANYSDETLMRNTLAYNLSGAMGMPQMETVWVDVVLNGEYVGNYQFCEQIKIDKNNRVSIFDWESLAEDAAEVIATAENFSDDDAGDLEDYMKEEDMSWITEGTVTFKGVTYRIADYPDIEVPAITGGYLMELDEYYDEVSKFRTNSDQPIMFKSPEFVTTNQDMMNYIQTYIQSFENAVQSSDYTAECEGSTTHYSELFDFDALVDYWLISEIFYNEELNKKSTYMYKDIDGLVYMGPIWDMDYSSGGEGETWRTDQWATVFYNTNAQANMWYKDLIKDPYFVLRAQERYWEIRDTYVQNMVDSIDTSYALLKDSADANAAIWYKGNHEFTSEVNNLRSWFNSHLAWLDTQMASEDALLSSLGYNGTALNISATDSMGTTLRKDIVSEKNAADMLVNIGESIILTVSSGTYNGQNATVFVNGKNIGLVQIGSNIVITNDQLTADSDEKNIIEVKISDYKDSVKNCITVLETDTSDLPPQEENKPGTDDSDKPETVNPEDSGRDYPVGSMTAFADSEYSGNKYNEGPAEYVLDEDEKTHWHTNWDTKEGMDVNMRWIGVELAEATWVDGIRCLPRQIEENGTVTSYEVQYRLTADEDWKTVASGEWDVYDKNWKLVSFEAVEAKYVRVVGIHTYATNEMDSHMSMAELRVLQVGGSNGDVDNGEEEGYPTKENKLPVVYINTENGVKITSKEKYVNATMKIQGTDTYSDSSILYDGEIEIRGRGNSTWSMPKKPYKIKLDKKSNLFDMGKNKHWVLLANYSDESLMRNTLAYNLSGAMGMPQMETVWVDVVLNGEYVGNYQFCEQIKVDKNNRVSIFDWESFAEDAAEVIATAENFSKDDAGDLEDYMKEENMSWITEGVVNFNNSTYRIADYPDIEVPAITGGYLMELDEYYDEVSKFKTNSNQPIMFKNPEFVGTNQDMMNYIQNYIQSFENAVQSSDYTAQYEGTATHYSQLFDFDALVDYWLISEIFFNEELNKKSTYMYKDIDGLVYMGPIWDMDYSSGGEGETWHTDQWATVYYNTKAQAEMWYKDLIKDPYFILRAQERYWEIRNTYVQDMLNSIDISYTLLKDSADANADIWYNRNRNFDSEVNNLRTWFNTHLAWLDTQMANEDSLLASLGYDTKAFTLSVTDSNGEALAEDTISDKNVADAMVNSGESIILTAASNTAKTGKADVFVNGTKIGFVEIGSNVIITAEQLTADSGEKNIIEVKLAGDKETAKNCITVVETADSGEEEPEVVDKTELQAKITEAEAKKAEDYTEASYAVLAEKLAAAKVVLENKEATQKEVNEVLFELNNALSGLEEKPSSGGTGDSGSSSSEEYTITYELNGGTNNSANPETYVEGSDVIDLESPTRKGYNFKGWFTDSEFNRKVTKIKKGTTGDITLYAKWSAKKYDITYKLNGGKNSSKNPKTYKITTSTFKLQEPTKKGYEFAGWYSDKNFTKKVTKIKKGSTGDVKLYAKWEAKEYDITYKLNGGKNNSKNPKSYTIETKSITLKKPTKSGYKFVGWYSDKKLTKKVTKIKKGSYGKVTLYAKWKKK